MARRRFSVARLGLSGKPEWPRFAPFTCYFFENFPGEAPLTPHPLSALVTIYFLILFLVFLVHLYIFCDKTFVISCQLLIDYCDIFVRFHGVPKALHCLMTDAFFSIIIMATSVLIFYNLSSSCTLVNIHCDNLKMLYLLAITYFFILNVLFILFVFVFLSIFKKYCIKLV